MDETDLEIFRLRFRVKILEQIALRLAFGAPVLTQGKSVEASRKQLVGYLRRASTLADEVYPKAVDDPAQAALYADEAREMIEEMVSFVNTLGK
jgi:hypothetical protein